MSGVMTVAKKVASRRHVIAKKPVTVKMMTTKKHPCLAPGTGKLHLYKRCCDVFDPCTSLWLYWIMCMFVLFSCMCVISLSEMRYSKQIPTLTSRVGLLLGFPGISFFKISCIIKYYLYQRNLP